MLRLLKFLFTGSWHEHTWVTINEYSIQKDKAPDKQVGIMYVEKCHACGKRRKTELLIND